MDKLNKLLKEYYLTFHWNGRCWYLSWFELDTGLILECSRKYESNFELAVDGAIKYITDYFLGE